MTELPIKLSPEAQNDDFYALMKSSQSPQEFRSPKPKSVSHHSSRNGHTERDEKKSRSCDSSEKQGSKSKHRHASSHSSSSSSSSSLKRKHECTSIEPKDITYASHKKPKLGEIPRNSTSNSKHRESTSSSSGSSTTSKENSHKKKSKKEESDEEVDGSQGIGFAEALALFDMPSTSKKSSKDMQFADKISKVTKSSSKSFRDEKRSSSMELFQKPFNYITALTAPPKLLSQKPKLEPLPDIVLSSDISIPEYRPSLLSSAVKDYINTSVHGNTSHSRPLKQMTDKELLTESFSSKANRTRVYSGNRVQRAVPSLFEMSIRVLQENIDYLECTGGVPFDILKPVLERAKPEQLSVIEYYNPYLLEESDVLWEPHCKRKFRTRKRLEMETWRELYERCTREDEIKLSKLTQNIKQHQDATSNGVQKTKMAFVDSMVKPPRGIQRKQEIFGTNRKLVVSAAARTVGLKNIMPNLAAPGDARLRVAAGLRDDAQQGNPNLLSFQRIARFNSFFKEGQVIAIRE